MPIPINDDLMISDQMRYEDLQSGMIVQQVITVPKGAFIYRFAQSKYPLETQLSSPWWFNEQEFLKLQRYFMLNPQNLGFIARTQAAVKYAWSELDVIQKAMINYPIKGFSGPGRWVVEKTDAGSTITFQAPADLLQMYLPGLREDEKTKQLSAAGKQVIAPLPAIPIPSGDAMDQRIQTLVGKNIIIPGNPRLH